MLVVHWTWVDALIVDCSIRIVSDGIYYRKPLHAILSYWAFVGSSDWRTLWFFFLLRYYKNCAFARVNISFLFTLQTHNIRRSFIFIFELPTLVWKLLGRSFFQVLIKEKKHITVLRVTGRQMDVFQLETYSYNSRHLYNYNRFGVWHERNEYDKSAFDRFDNNVILFKFWFNSTPTCYCVNLVC